MAKERRLIDANDALERLKIAEQEMFVVQMMGCKAVDVDGVIEFIKTRPTVDAVPVILCKNCANKEPCTIRGKVWCRRMGRYMKEDGYCSEGDNGRNNPRGEC